MSFRSIIEQMLNQNETLLHYLFQITLKTSSDFAHIVPQSLYKFAVSEIHIIDYVGITGIYFCTKSFLYKQ